MTGRAAVSTLRTSPTICPRSWAGTSGASSSVCWCCRLCTMPTSWRMQWRFESNLAALLRGSVRWQNKKFCNQIFCFHLFCFYLAPQLSRLHTHECTESFTHFVPIFFLWQGAGTEEACLIDILASRSNDEIKAINAFYKKSEWLHVYE